MTAHRKLKDAGRKKLSWLFLALLCLSSSGHVLADDWAPGIPLGTTFPNINAPDQDNRQWTNRELLAEKGLVFFFVRSSDW